MLTKAPAFNCKEVTMLDAEPKLTPPAIVAVGKLTVPETVAVPAKTTGPAVAVKSPAVAATVPPEETVRVLALRSNFPAVSTTLAVVQLLVNVTTLVGLVPVLFTVKLATVAGKPVPVVWLPVPLYT